MSEDRFGIRAFVLCGGLGTRLRSVVSDRPKSMALVSGAPFLELILRQLRQQGVSEVVLGTGYKAEQIEEYFQNGAALDLKIRYSQEREPLGTGGALKLAESFLHDPILVLNGDSFVEWNLVAMRELSVKKDASIAMVLQAVPDVSRYGSVALDAEGRVTGFVEKGSRTGPGLINAGVYLLRKEIVRDLAAGKPISLEREVFPQFLGRNFYGIISHGTFIDIGIPADLERAQTVLRSN